MSRARPSQEEKELARQIYADARHRQSEPATGQEPPIAIGGGLRGARRLIRRSRLGFIGSEPVEARRPVARTYLAEYGALAALLVILAGSMQAAVVILVVCLLVGVPRAWTWTHDRLGSGLWSLSAVLLIAAEIAWENGGSARATLSAHGGPGAGLVLALIAGFIGVLGFFRRWGTSGNVFYIAGQNDPEAQAVVAEAARREGDAGPR